MNIRVGLGIVAAVLLVGCSNEGPETAQVGAPVPDKPVESLAQPGKTVSPRDFSGKVVVLDFWATWCGPCKEFMPHLQAMYDTYHAKGMEVMSITNESRDVVSKFRKKEPYTFPAYLDSFDLLNTAFEVESIPKFAVIDRQGNVVYDGGADEQAIRKAVEDAL